MLLPALIVGSAESGILQKRSLNRRWQAHQDEAPGWEQVIFTALIHYPEVTIRLGVFVRQHPVDLVQLQRRWVAVIIHADGEPYVLLFLFHDSSPDTAFA